MSLQRQCDDDSMVLEIDNCGNHLWGTTDIIVGNQKNVFDFFGWRISRTMGDGLFSKRCDTEVSWTHVTIATDAVIWTRPSLPLNSNFDSKDLKLPLRYRLLFLDMTFQQTFPYITLRPLLPVSQVNLKIFHQGGWHPSTSLALISTGPST